MNMLAIPPWWMIMINNWELVLIDYLALLWLVGYIPLAAALFSLARAGGIGRPWLAWLPVGRFWMLGNLSDRCRLRNRRVGKKYLLMALSAMAFLLFLSMAFLATDFPGGIAMEGVAFSLGIFLTSVLLLSIVGYMALYDLIACYLPKRKRRAMILSVLLPFMAPVYLLICVRRCREQKTRTS